MKSEIKLTICGGDKRYLTAYKLFSEKGYNVKYTNIDDLKNIRNTDVLILPINSFDSDGNMLGTNHTIYDLLGMLKSKALIFAGKVPSIIKRIAEEHKIFLYDYTDNEEFNILNAVATAEGAILTLLNKSQNTISHSKYIILGYGRIGKALATRLRFLGADVIVGARSAAARANAISDGLSATTIPSAIEKSLDAHAIFNTIPCPIINDENIKSCKNCFIIDLASIPGGLTEKAKFTAGESFIHALSLPGKYFPNTAGETIFKTIESILMEKGVII